MSKVIDGLRKFDDADAAMACRLLDRLGWDLSAAKDLLTCCEGMRRIFEGRYLDETQHIAELQDAKPIIKGMNDVSSQSKSYGSDLHR